MNVHRIVSHCHAFSFFFLLDDQSSSMMNCFPTGTESDLFDVDEKCLLFFSESLLSTEVTAVLHMIYVCACHLRRQEARTTQIVCHFFSLMFFIINRSIDRSFVRLKEKFVSVCFLHSRMTSHKFNVC